MPQNPPRLSSRAVDPSVLRVDPGLLTLVTGCMFSGKTTELIRRVEASAPGRTVAIKHSTDVRFAPAQIVSHAGKAIDSVVVSTAAQILDYADECTELVAVDEGHFFDEGLIGVVATMTRHGIHIVVAALQPDSWGRPFPLVERLALLADESVLETAVCARCGGNADRTQRLTPIVNGQMVVSPDEYEPRCRTCWRAPPEAPID